MERVLRVGARETRIEFCGEPRVMLDGNRVDGDLRGRILLLFAYLALNRGRPVSRGELEGALWPFEAPVNPGAALRTSVSRLRTSVGADRVTGRAALRLWLPADAWVDAEASVDLLGRAEADFACSDFEHARTSATQALEIEARPFMPGYVSPWVEERRAELADVGVAALEVQAKVGLALGGAELRPAEHAARALIRRAPFRESAHRLLITTLARSGNAAEAVCAYNDLRIRLREQFGASPTAELQSLYARLLSGDVVPDLAPA